MIKLLILINLLFMSVAEAAGIKVLYSRGKVYKKTIAGKYYKIKKGSRLKETDTIITKKKGFVIFRMYKHSTHRVEGSSIIRIDGLPYFYEKSKKLEQPASLYMKIGTMLSRVDKTHDSESLKVKTRTAILGVRGTKFLISQDKKKDVVMSVKEGTVEVKSPKTGQKDFLTKNESIVVEKKSGFTARKMYDFTKKIDWNLKSKKPKISFNQLRGSFRSEFLKKKTRWVKDLDRLNKFQNQWKARQKAFARQVQNLQPSRLLKKRRKELRKLLNKHKQFKKDLTKNINGEKQKLMNGIAGEKDKLNGLMKKKKLKKIDAKKQKRKTKKQIQDRLKKIKGLSF